MELSKKFNKLLLVTLTTLSILFLNGCDKMILEKEYVCNLKAEQIRENGDEYLIVSGLCGHSAYGINDVEIKKQNNRVIIIIRVAQGLNGNFTAKIKLDKDVNEVSLGNNRGVIWTRK